MPPAGDTVLRHIRGTYQGLPVSDGSYTIRSGLAPDDGWIEFDSELVDTSRLAISQLPPVPWGGPAAVSPLQTVSIGHFAGITIGVGDAPADPGSAARFSQLHTWGTLVLDGGDRGRIEIHEVYLDRDTAQEKGEPSDTGEQTVRVRLTCLRSLWHDYGDCFGLVNQLVVAPWGQIWEPRSVQPDGTPWDLGTVLRWLMHHLPGPPRIRGWEDLAHLPPPTDVVLRREPPLPAISRLVNQYGLFLDRLPDGTFSIGRRRSRPFASIPGATEITRQRSLEIRHPPTGLTIVGERVRRNIRRTLLPVSHDLDGRVYDLAEIIGRYTTLDYALSQMPGVGGRDYGRLRGDIREIAQRDWGRLFQVATAIASDGSIPQVDIPILDPIASVAPSTRETVRGIVTGAGASGVVIRDRPRTQFIADGSGRQAVLPMPPQVRAHVYGQSVISAANLGDLFRDSIRAAVWWRTRLHRRALALARERDRLDRSIHYLDTDGRRDTWVSMRMIDRLIRDHSERLRSLEAAISRTSDEVEAVERELARMRDMAERARLRVDFLPEDRLWSNLGERMLAPDEYSVVDARRGLVRVSVPVGFVLPALSLNQEHLRLASLPTLDILYSVEYDTRTPADHYALSVLYGGGGGAKTYSRARGTWPDPADHGRGEQAPSLGASLSVIPIHVPSLVLYADERGTEFNGKICDDAARLRAEEFASSNAASQIEGLTVVYDGWHVPPPDARGIDSITYGADSGLPRMTLAMSNRHQPAIGRDSPALAGKIGATIAAAHKAARMMAWR